MTYTSSINTVLAASAHVSASNAAAAGRALDDIIATELESVAEVISQKDVFREAAIGMIAEITRKLSTGLTSDLQEIHVREGLLSVFKTAVPADIASAVKTEAQGMVNEVVRDALKEDNCTLTDIAENGLLDEEETIYEPGTGSLLVHDLNDDDAAHIAKLGVIHIIQQALEETELCERPEGETRQKHRALSVAFEHALNSAWDISEKIRVPVVKALSDNSPGPAI